MQNNKIFIGVDVSKDSFNFSILNQNLDEIFVSEFQMDCDGFKNFKQVLKQFSNSIVADVVDFL